MKARGSTGRKQYRRAEMNEIENKVNNRNRTCKTTVQLLGEKKINKIAESCSHSDTEKKKSVDTDCWQQGSKLLPLLALQTLEGSKRPLRVTLSQKVWAKFLKNRLPRPSQEEFNHINNLISKKLISNHLDSSDSARAANKWPTWQLRGLGCDRGVPYRHQVQSWPFHLPSGLLLMCVAR